MCGLAGLLQSGGVKADEARSRLQAMTDSIVHRGPDDEGHWLDPECGIGLGFRRLAILELSPLGAQPMASATRRYTLLFNGEVYNFVELREELRSQNITPRGGSDTEIILACFEAWGIERSLARFIGMFAIAVWDAQERALTLARDRVGIKPLYFFHRDGVLLFASELKALCRDPAFDSQIDPAAFSDYLRYLFIPAPRSVYKHVRKLPPGHFLKVHDSRALPDPEPYWSLEAAASEGLRSRLTLSDADTIALLEGTLSEAVGIRLRSDVPLGLLLSGGIDSSLVAALAQKQLDRPLRTFSIGFDVAEHDESHHARAVSDHLGTEHTELAVSGDDVLATVPQIASIFDEPLADPSQVPTFLVSKLAREAVTVALGGDGGDELFGGYNRYSAGRDWIHRLGSVPRGMRSPAAAALSAVPAKRWDQLLSLASPALGDRVPRLVGEKIQKLAGMMRSPGEWQMYRTLLAAGWESTDRVTPDELSRVEHPDLLESGFRTLDGAGLMERMMFADQSFYLPDDLLAKVDRTSMAVSLEVRVPLLDHRVIELSWRLPTEMKVRDGTSKWILRELLYRHVPRAIVDRPKVGFTPPIASWLTGGLRDWAGDLIGSDGLKSSGLFDSKAVQRQWRGLQNGRTDLALGLWAIVQWQAWHDEYRPSVG